MIAQSRFLGKWGRLLGLRYAGTHVDTTDAPKAPRPVRGRCITWPGMMKALLIFAHSAECILHMLCHLCREFVTFGAIPDKEKWLNFSHL